MHIYQIFNQYFYLAIMEQHHEINRNHLMYLSYTYPTSDKQYTFITAKNNTNFHHGVRYPFEYGGGLPD